MIIHIPGDWKHEAVNYPGQTASSVSTKYKKQDCVVSKNNQYVTLTQQ